MLTGKTTIIVPFYFRESQETNLFNVDEPHTVTLARYWAERYLPIVYDHSPDQVPQALRDLPLWSEVIRKLQALPMQKSLNAKSVSEIRGWLVKQLETIDLQASQLSIKDIHAAFTAEAALHVAYIQNLWAPLSEVEVTTFNKDHPKAFGDQQEAIILKTRQLINGRKMAVGTNKDQIKFKGLNTRMGSSGMSPSLKRLWCVDGVDEEDHIEESSKLKKLIKKLSPSSQFDHPMTGRGLSLMAHPRLLSLLSQDAQFKLVKKQTKQSIGLIKLSRVFLTFLSEQNGFLCFSFDLLKGAQDKQLTLDVIQQLIYGLCRSRTEYVLEACQPRVFNAQEQKLVPDSLTQQSFNLNQLSLWLISLSNDHHSDDRQQLRTGYLRRFIHHSSVYVDDTLSEHGPQRSPQSLNTSREYTWRLARALGNDRFAPLNIYIEQGEGGMQLYENVLIETSVEGSACLVWKPSRGQFNIQNWAIDNFHDIYLILHLHARGEESGLHDFSYKSLELIRELRPLTHNKRERGALSVKIIKLKKLILDMVYFNLSFNSASAGGYSDHMAYLKEVREVHSLDRLREELKVNIAELGELVAREETADRDQEEQEFNRLISLFGTIVIPFGLFSGLYGMNNFNPDQVPLGLSFWGIIAVSIMTSALAYAFIHRKKIWRALS